MYPDDASRHLRAKIFELLENLRRGPIHVLRDATLRLRREGRKLLAQIPVDDVLHREIRAPEPIADLSEPNVRAETRESQPTGGINSALGNAFNTAGSSNDADVTVSTAIVSQGHSQPDISALQSAIEQMNQTSANNLYMLQIAQNSENSMHQNWIEAKHQMKEEMGIADINARAMAIQTMQSEANCAAYKRLCEEVGEEDSGMKSDRVAAEHTDQP